jgi:TRAP-type C4-dicarboxylate transport system permease small subunit
MTWLRIIISMLPVLLPREWRALIALFASIAGAAVLTGFAWWMVDLLRDMANRLITELVRDPGVKASVGTVLETIIESLAWSLKLVLAGMIAVLLSLGLAINRRTVKLGKEGFEATGGDEALPVRVTNTPGDPVPVEEKP